MSSRSEAAPARRPRLLALLTATACAVGAPAAGVAQAQETPTTAFTIEQIKEALASGRHSSVQLTQAYLDRIDRYEPAYNAFTTMNPEALREAAAADAARAAGRPLGPLAGVPVAVKDAVDIAGLPTTAGWWGFTRARGVELIPSRDAPLVARLRAAGAVIVGKTNLPTFANSGSNANDSWAGPTFNALDRRWAPGGSSTGSATAVAAGFAAASIAEETGGSIQNPAVAQSLVGIKTTFGLVPTTGVVPLAGQTRDVVGPLAQTVRDAATMLDALAGPTPADPKTRAARGKLPRGGYAAGLSATALEGTRLGLYGDGWRRGDSMDAATARLYRAAVATIRRQGATTVADPFAGSGFNRLARATGGYDSRGSEALPHELDGYLRGLGPDAAVRSLPQLVRTLRFDPLGPRGPLWYYSNLPGYRASRANPGRPVDLSSFNRLRARYLRAFDRVMDRTRLDALVFPQGTEEIGRLRGGDVSATTVSEINIAGLPGVVVPAGRYPSGKPFALIFVGRKWSEARLLAYAYDYEEAAPGRVLAGSLEMR